MRLLHTLVLLATVSAAAPSNFFNNAYDFSEELASYYVKVSQYIKYIKKNEKAFTESCDTSKISLPTFASSLPQPDGLTPLYVAIGRGTQNYTCATSSSTSTPVAIGAVANLYNATCIAANYPDLLALLPSVAYKIALPQSEWASFPPANVDLMGHHFFQNSTTPEFNLDLTPEKQFGYALTKKVDSISAPSSAAKGKYGAVAWLYLTAISGTEGPYKSVYRVQTASGSPPTTCEGMAPSFEIAYAANYYFFS
ncbi:hypothetical protein N7495_002322 [Penicillium taxi]|uniref:uncharacterized protein n=1 Tax=Penicillium taxi TaxID=168475 RepID=UPI002544F8C8|nr:uncharacterized protein N7495_002322 [Penicillium taxi]KAJ5901794.1 hypothetical protein N7495_002322 [Penicillium taxi]